MATLTDRSAALGDVVDLDETLLLEALRRADDTGQVTTVIAQMITARVASSRSRPPHLVQRGASLLSSGLGVGETCEQLGVRRAPFAAAFRMSIGTTPKMFARLQRFENAVTRAADTNAAGLALIAAESGYADQAHMSREFTDLAGRPPSSLHRIGNDAAELLFRPNTECSRHEPSPPQRSST